MKVRKLGFAVSAVLVLVIAASLFSGVSKVSANTCAGPAHCWQQYVVDPPTSSGNNQLNSVYAVSTKDIWAVGYYNNGSKDQTLAEHGVLSGSDYSWSNVLPLTRAVATTTSMGWPSPATTSTLLMSGRLATMSTVAALIRP